MCFDEVRVAREGCRNAGLFCEQRSEAGMREVRGLRSCGDSFLLPLERMVSGEVSGNPRARTSIRRYRRVLARRRSSKISAALFLRSAFGEGAPSRIMALASDSLAVLGPVDT